MIDTLNSFTEKFIKDEMNFVNENVQIVNVLPDNIEEYYSINPILNWQDLSDNSSVYVLNAAKDYNPLKKTRKSNFKISRLNIHYSDIVSKLGDYEIFKVFMKNVIESALEGLEQTLGFSYKQRSIGQFYLSLRSIPGVGAWRHLENSPGFELRLVSDCELDVEYANRQFNKKLKQEVNKND